MNADQLPLTPGYSESLRRVLHPESVAVVGASGRPASLPALTLDNLLRFGFSGEVYPVNPRYDELGGRQCFPSLTQVPGPIDLVLVLTPAATTHDVIVQCIDVGAAGAVIFSSGFAELGQNGRSRQERLVATARRGGLRVLGPNCQGFLHQGSGLVATFSAAVEAGLGAPSGVAYVGQSGAVGGSFLGLARERGIGLTSWVSTGNESDITASDVATALVEEDEVRALAMYIEAIPDGRAWESLLLRAKELNKHVVVLRSGRSAAGRAAAVSHTGAMIGHDAAFSLMCERYGVLEVDDLASLLDTMVALTPGRIMPGPSVAVVTSSGGAGGLAADQLDAAGLKLAVLGADTREDVAQLIPAYGSTTNPIDVTAQLFSTHGAPFGTVLSRVLADDAVDGALVALTQVIDERAAQVATAVVAAAAATTKPFGVVWMAERQQTHEARRILLEAGVPVFADVADAANALARLRQQSPPGAPHPDVAPERLSQFLDEVAAAGAAVLTETQGGVILDALRIRRPEGLLVTDAAGAAAAARRLGEPVALKVQSSDILHKTEAGGVRLGVTAGEAGRAFDEISAEVRTACPGARVDGVLVQAMAASGVELIVGVEGAREQYPPVVTVGLGGVTTELYADVTSALAPLSTEQASSLLRRLRGWPLLDGYRGRPRFDVDAAAEAVSALSRAAVALGPRLVELEVNPLIVHLQGATAVDLLLRHRVDDRRHVHRGLRVSADERE